MAKRNDVQSRASEIDAQFGLDTEEALCRYEQAGGYVGGADAKAWVSVAFMLARWQKVPKQRS